MKLLLSILLILCCNICNSQQKKHIDKKWVRIGLFTGSILLNAVGDGLYDQNHKLISKSFKAASIGALLTVPLVSPPPKKKKAFKYVLTYGLLRFGLFDIAYNTSRGLPINYVGTTSLQDRIIGGQPKLMIAVIRLSSIGVSIKLNDEL